MRRSLVGSFMGLLAGCNSTLSVSEVIPGIYSLKVMARTDSCTPASFLGELGRATAVITIPDALSVSDEMGQRVELHAEAGYATRMPKLGDRIVPCLESRDGSVVKTYTLTAAEKTRVELEAVLEWDKTSVCPGAGSGWPFPPKDSCRWERTLIYELQTECRMPCTVRWLPADPVASFCDCSSSPTR